MKRLKPTDKIKEKLAAALGTPDFPIDQYAIFETTMNNDLPISKKGSIFDGSVMTLATLNQIVNKITSEGFLPLHTLHQQANQLPVGRVFHAEMHQTTNKVGKLVNEVRSLFYIPLSTDQGKQLADGVDTGIINEVSSGSRPAKLLCSVPDCGFDYMGPKAGFMNFLDCTCNNDHTIGKDGVHAIFDGISKLFELSLVSQGAADHAQIHPAHQSIAASANDDAPEYQLLYATKGTEKDNIMKLTAAQIAELKTELEKSGKVAIEAKFSGVVDAMGLIKADMSMDDAKAVRDLFKTEIAKFDAKVTADAAAEAARLAAASEPASVTDLKANLIVAQRDLTALNASLVAKDTVIATLISENTQLKANKVQLDAMTAEVTPVKDFLKLACQNLMVASGVKAPVVPETLTELVASIKIAQASLSKLPTGGLLLASESGTGKSTTNTNGRDPSAFKTVKEKTA